MFDDFEIGHDSSSLPVQAPRPVSRASLRPPSLTKLQRDDAGDPLSTDADGLRGEGDKRQRHPNAELFEIPKGSVFVDSLLSYC